MTENAVNPIKPGELERSARAALEALVRAAVQVDGDWGPSREIFEKNEILDLWNALGQPKDLKDGVLDAIADLTVLPKKRKVFRPI